MSDNNSQHNNNSRRGMGMRGGGDKPKDFKGSLKNLLKYLSPYYKSFILVIIFSILSTVFTIVGPRILGNITNQIVQDYTSITVYDKIIENMPKGMPIPEHIKGEDILKTVPKSIIEKIPSNAIEQIKGMDFSSKPTFHFDVIGRMILELAAIYILSSVLGYIVEWIMSGISKRVTYKFRKDIFDKINRLPLRYFDNQTHGDILSRMTNDVDMISQNLNRGVIQIITSISTVIGILIMMFSISSLLTAVAIVILPIGLSSIVFVAKRSQSLFKKQQDYLGEINGHIEEVYSGHTVVKAFNGEEKSLNTFNDINEKLYNTAWKSQFFSGLMMPIMNLINNAGYVAVAVLGGKLAIDGVLKIGDIQAFIQYMNQFTQPIAQLANIANVLQSMAASSERVFEFLNAEEEIEDPIDAIEIEEVKGSIKFNDVVFGYTKDNPVIKDFNADIAPGQMIAIVGPTGAGKTTIVNLLMRFYDVDSGSIEVDGIDIRKMSRRSVRNMFGMVLQDTWLFSGTIRENISYGKQDASDAEIIEAAKNAYVDNFIHSLPDGYDMVIDEDADNISQGEKQLITIARAMLANRPMLILDEATSSVDTRTEILIQQAMDKLMEGRTTFVIAHRLSTIRNADLILVMNNGSIVEKGKHDELLKKNGFYASIYNSQFNNGNTDTV